MGIKINVFIAAGIILIAFVAIYLALRDTPKKSLRRAEKYHMLGQRAYEKGDTESAKLNYEIAKQYREKALDKGEK